MAYQDSEVPITGLLNRRVGSLDGSGWYESTDQLACGDS